ncbi:uncharacterized protein V6R79_021673 [Siganus canaliculatus]
MKAIKQHYQEGENEQEGQVQEKDATDPQEDSGPAQTSAEEGEGASCGEDVPVFVNTRRGRGNCTKRKISDTATAMESDAKLPTCAAEGVSSAPRDAKKRKVTSTTNSNKSETVDTGSEQQLAVKDEAPAKVNKVAKGGKIPRLQSQQQKTKPILKPITPNFKKLHEAHFNKMESIDSYFQRKNKQVETYRSSVKELKKLSDKTKLQQVERKTQVKATRASMLSPAPLSKKATEDKRRHTLLSASKAPPNKPAKKEEAPFRPSVLSVRRINVRFSEATCDYEHKRSMVKTPARMSPCVTSSTPLKQTTDAGKASSVKPSALSATKTSGAFVFTGNTSFSMTPGTQKKSQFDLKASLARPLNYKPHTGKLKPFGETKENAAANKSLDSVSSHQKCYKQRQVQTRENRRAKHMEGRKQNKDNLLGARRGLAMM